MRAIYTNFAYIYDKLMYDIDYSKWVEYIEAVFKANGLEPRIILDLGCGTGNFCIEMAKRGYDMIGIDLSTEMLSCAKEKSEDEGVDVLYLNQDMTNFELYGTVDAVVSLMDSVNYITSKNKIKRTLSLVKTYLNPGGIFIFDINTCYKLEKVLGNEVFYDINDEVSYIWENSYDKRRKLSRFDLTFFVNDKGTYKRFDETHLERGYSIKELKDMIQSSGMELISIFHELSFNRATPKSKRVFFVCRKSIL